MPGRPTKLTPERGDSIIATLEQGVPLNLTALAHGVHRDTIMGWVRRGDEDHDTNHPDPDTTTMAQLRALAAAQDVDLPAGRLTKAKVAQLVTIPTVFSDFSDRYKAAQGRAFIYIIQEARRCGKDDWKFWITLGERLFPDQLARRWQPPQEEGPGMTAEQVAADGELVLKVLEGGKQEAAG